MNNGILVIKSTDESNELFIQEKLEGIPMNYERLIGVDYADFKDVTIGSEQKPFMIACNSRLEDGLYTVIGSDYEPLIYGSVAITCFDADGHDIGLSWKDLDYLTRHIKQTRKPSGRLNRYNVIPVLGEVEEEE